MQIEWMSPYIDYEMLNLVDVGFLKLFKIV